MRTGFLWWIVATLFLSLSGRVFFAADDVVPAAALNHSHPPAVNSSQAHDVGPTAPDASPPAPVSPPSAGRTASTDVSGKAPASSPAAGKNASPGDTPAAAVEEVRPSVFYLPDEQGRLQAVLDFSYEDFVTLYHLQQQLARHQQRPRYSLQKLIINGRVVGGHVALTAQVQIMVHHRDWVRIPLRFNQALLTRPAEFQGKGESLVHYHRSDGYVCWLRSASEGPQEVSLQMLLPLTSRGRQTQLRLCLPPATVAEMKLQTPTATVAGQVSEGAMLLPPDAADDGGTEWTIRGPRGDFQFCWSQAGQTAPETPPVLEVEGNVVVRLQPHRVLSEAALSVRSYGAPCERFRVRLPPEAKLTSSSPADAAVTLLDSADPTADAAPLVEVRLARPATQPTEIRLIAQRAVDSQQSPEWLELAGFEVLGAARQWGTVAVAAPPEGQVLWGVPRGARQIDQPPKALRLENLAAAFEYAVQPYSLPVRLAPRHTRIHLEPEYVFFVERDRVELDAKLAFTIRGAKVSRLQLLLPGWEFDDAGPENLLAVEAVDRTDAGLVTLPLQQPASGPLELRLRAHRPLPPGTTTLKFPLPQLQGATAGSAVVAVVPADNVEVIPDNQATQGLIRQPVAPPLKLPPRQQDPLFYRSEGRSALFAADVHGHSRHVETQVFSLIRPQERFMLIEQKFLLHVAYEPLDQILFDVPEGAPAKDLEFYCGEKPMTAKTLEPAEAAAVSPGRVQMRVALAEAVIGPMEIQARYRLPPLTPTARTPHAATVPLILPAEGTLGENRVVVVPPPDMKITLRGKAWQLVETETGGEPLPAQVVLRAEGPQDEVALTVERESAADRGTLVIERGWIQTWFTRDARQERAVFQFTSNQKELVLHLPDGADLLPRMVLLDGNRTACRAAEPNRLCIPLSADRQWRRHVLEARYHFHDSRPPRGRLVLDFPRFEKDSWMRRLYWQLVLPRQEHLLFNPSGFESECRWRFHGGGWGRKPLWNQTELENWIGAPHAAPLSEGVNVYLFSTMGDVGGAQVRTMDRAAIILWASGASLALGLMLIYWPVARHPVVLLLFIAALATVGLLHPEPALLIAQASILGWLLSGVVAAWERCFAPHRIPSRAAEMPSVYAGRGSTRILSPVVGAAAEPPTTQVIPALDPAPPAEPSSEETPP